MTLKHLFYLLTAVAVVTFTACGDDDDAAQGCTDPTALNFDPNAEEDCCCQFAPVDDHIHMNLKFSHVVSGNPLAFDNIQYTNAAGHTYSVVTLKYFISNVTLTKADGSTVTVDKYFYVDGKDNSTLDQELGMNIDAGIYTGISFMFGIDSAVNVVGLFNNPPESNMEWPMAMGPGYHYMKLEGKFDSASLGTIELPYNTHTGQSMGNPFTFTVNLPNSGFTAAQNDLNVNLEMDINEWYEDPNQYNFANFGPMIMGNQMAQNMLMENGANVFSLTSIEAQQ